MRTLGLFSVLVIFLLNPVANNVFAQKAPPKSVKTEKPVSKKPLTNEDIIKLTKAGFDEDLILSRISMEPHADFDMSADGLTNLKQNGVSKTVITAMMNKMTPQAGESKSPPAQPQTPSPPPLSTEKPKTLAARSIAEKVIEQNTSSVILCTKKGNIELEGKIGRANFSLMKAFASYPALKAKQRTDDRNPSFILGLPYEPAGQVFIVKLEQEKEDSTRVLKCGKTLFRLTTKGMGLPEEDVRIPFEFKPEGKDLWRLSLKKNLDPGEYGVYVLAASAVEAGILYDFGLD